MFYVKMDLDRLEIKPNKNITQAEMEVFKSSTGYFILKNYLTGYTQTIRQRNPIGAYIELDFLDVTTNTINTYYFPNFK